MELVKPTGPVRHGGSSGSGIQRDDATRTGATRNADARPLEASDVEMNGEDPCAAQVKRAKTIMKGLEICVLEALDDVFDEPPETPTNLAGTPDENETEEDVVSPEVTEELNRLKSLGRPYTAPSADELMPRTFVYSQKTNEQVDKRMVAEGRERELGALCSEGALFVIPRTALSPDTKMVRGRFVDDMKNGRVKSRFVAAEVARDVRYDVHAGTPALKALRMIVSLAATRDGKHRPRSMAFYDIVAAFVHASIDEVVGVVPQDGLLEKGECFLLLKALYGTRMASKRWQRHYVRVLRTHGWNASKVMPGFFHHRDRAGTCGCHGDDFMAEGSDALLDRLDRVMTDEFEAKMLGRVGRGHLAEVKFLKRTIRWHEDEMCSSWSGRTRYVTELAVLLGLTDTRSVMMTRTPGTKATGGNARDSLEQLDTFQAATFRSAVGLIGYIVLDRPECQYAVKTVRSATREPTNLGWMRMMRLAKFQCHTVNSNGSIMRRTCLRSMWCLETQTGQARSHVGARQQHVNSTDYIPSNSVARHSTSLLSRAGRQSCMLQDVRRREDCSQSSCWLRLEWSRSWKYSRTVPRTSEIHNRIGSGRVRHLDVKWLWTQEAVQSGRFSLKKVSTDRNVSDLTTKHHHEDRLAVLMSLGRLRFARGRGDAVLAANECRTAAVNAVRRTMESTIQ